MMQWTPVPPPGEEECPMIMDEEELIGQPWTYVGMVY